MGRGGSKRRRCLGCGGRESMGAFAPLFGGAARGGRDIAGRAVSAAGRGLGSAGRREFLPVEPTIFSDHPVSWLELRRSDFSFYDLRTRPCLSISSKGCCNNLEPDFASRGLRPLCLVPLPRPLRRASQQHADFLGPPVTPPVFRQQERVLKPAHTIEGALRDARVPKRFLFVSVRVPRVGSRSRSSHFHFIIHTIQ